SRSSSYKTTASNGFCDCTSRPGQGGSRTSARHNLASSLASWSRRSGLKWTLLYAQTVEKERQIDLGINRIRIQEVLDASMCLTADGLVEGVLRLVGCARFRLGRLDALEHEGDHGRDLVHLVLAHPQRGDRGGAKP